MAPTYQISRISSNKFALDDGTKEVDLRLIGQGAFTLAFARGRGAATVVYAATEEPALDKRVMARALHHAPGNPHLPPLQDLGPVEIAIARRRDFISALPEGCFGSGHLFRMPLVVPYEDAPARMLTRDLERQVEALRSCVAEGDLRRFADVEGCLKDLRLDEPMAEALWAMADAVADFAEEAKQLGLVPMMETPDRNLAIFGGDLVLLDVLAYLSEKDAREHDAETT